MSGALKMTTPRGSYPFIEAPHYSLYEDLKTEFRSNAHTRPAETGSTPVSDLPKVALHAMALFTNANDLHASIENLTGELEAGLLLAKCEAELLKHKLS